MKYLRSDTSWEFNSRLSKDDNKWLYYGEGYKLAIEILEKQILEIDRTQQDFLIYPFCYLIRHYIELRLKEIIDEGNKILAISTNPSEGKHNLAVLWSKSQETLKLVWKENYVDAPKDVFRFINEIHTIDIKSENFRYSIDNKQNDSLHEKIFNFKVLSEGFIPIKHYLEGIADGLAVLKDTT